MLLYPGWKSKGIEGKTINFKICVLFLQGRGWVSVCFGTRPLLSRLSYQTYVQYFHIIAGKTFGMMWIAVKGDDKDDSMPILWLQK